MLAALSRSETLARGELGSALAEITQAAARTLDVVRVNVWLLNQQRSEIRCIEQYERLHGQHSRGTVLRAADYPAYFAAIESARTIAADDAVADPRTSKFAESYLSAVGVAALLVAPIRRGGQLVGLVGHEHAGAPRRWKPDEENFAASVADFVALALEAHERRRAQEALSRAHDELERRVRDRTAELTRANENLSAQIAQREQTEALLLESEARWRSLVANAPNVIMLVDRSGKLLFANRSLAQAAGSDRADSTLYDWLPASQHERARAALAQVFASGQPVQYELQGYGAQGQPVWHCMVAGPVRQGDEVVAATVLSTDITDRKQAEDRLRHQTNILRSVLDSIGDGVAVIDGDGRFVLINPAAAAMLRLELLGARVSELGRRGELFRADQQTPVPPDALPIVRALHGESASDAELYLRHAGLPEGVLLSINARPVIDSDGRQIGAVAVFRDVTEKRRAAEMLEAKQRLLEQLLIAHERSRQLTAYEIHDGLVQDLTASLLYLEAFRGPAHQAESNAEFELAVKLLRSTLDEARRLISGLRPPIIDEQGVLAAIQYLLDEQDSAGGPAIELYHDVGFDRLEPLLEATIFRIVQEALANVRKHSQAQRARVSLVQVGDGIQLEVRDWGIGFEPSGVSADRFGLAGIRERARLLRGVARIESQPGEGTRVHVELPITQAIRREGSGSVE